MLRSVQNFVKQYRLFQPGETVLAAVSGGADSVAMLDVLTRLTSDKNLKLIVAHLDHRLRGRAAERDAAFVRELADRLGLPCVVGRVDVRRRARRRGVSLEMAAREARYGFFRRTARRTGATAVATAHTADDQAETLILNLARGAGPAGLSGIPRQSTHHGVRVVRPLLHVTRKQVLDYLKSRHLAWQEDASNTSRDFLRNRVRHDVLPYMEKKLNPGIRKILARTADVMAEEEAWADTRTAACLETCVGPDGALAIHALLDYPVAQQRRILRHWAKSSDLFPEPPDFDTLQRLMTLARSSRPGGMTDIGGGWSVTREYDRLLTPSRTAGLAAPPPFRQAVRVPGRTSVAAAGIRIVTHVGPGLVKQKGRRPGALPARACLCRRTIGRKKLFVRSWRDGDRIRPLGMQGSKKLQDIFVDAKVPASLRRQVPVFECGGDIVWLPGYGVAHGWQVDDPAAPALHVSVSETGPGRGKKA